MRLVGDGREEGGQCGGGPGVAADDQAAPEGGFGERPRRWLLFVLLPCALLCGAGIVVGAPLMWIIG